MWRGGHEQVSVEGVPSPESTEMGRAWGQTLQWGIHFELRGI